MGTHVCVGASGYGVYIIHNSVHIIIMIACVQINNNLCTMCFCRI